MSEKQHFVLSHSTARNRAMHAIAHAPEGWVVEIKAPTRTLEQNAKFHAMCGDLARSGIPWLGKPRAAKPWKVLLVSGHAIASGEGAEIIPGLENEFVNIRESTALMSKRRSASLIEYTLAFGAMHDVRWSDPMLYPKHVEEAV